MPYTGIVLAIVGIHAALFLILLGHWVASAGMFPHSAKKFAEIYDTRPLRAVLVGVFTYGPLILLLLQAGKMPSLPFRLLVIFAGLGALLLAMIGSAGLALRIGRNLGSHADTWQQVLRGGIMLALVFITPALGSLFLLHVGLASGFGAFLLAKPWKSAAETTPLAVSPATPLSVPPPMPAATALS